MSHQSGITPSRELVEAFASATDSVRALRVVIEQENLNVAETLPASGSWESDFGSIQPWLHKTDPSFILYRRAANEWLLLQYVPDHARVRDKMLYASTKATLTKELGDSKFVDTMYGTTPAEMSWDSYQKHLVHKSAEAPLTEREQELQTVKLAESGADIAISSRRAHAQGVNFPISPAATAALQKLKDASDLTVILTIDTAKESIELDKAEATSIQSLATVVPADVPRFVFLPYVHTFEGESCSPIIFAYICPPQSKVKERMLFSSSRATLLSFVEEQLQLPVARKLELDSVDELDEADLLDSLHPKRAEVLSAKPAFSRPRGPGGRGTPRSSRPGTPASTGSA